MPPHDNKTMASGLLSTLLSQCRMPPTLYKTPCRTLLQAASPGVAMCFVTTTYGVSRRLTVLIAHEHGMILVTSPSSLPILYRPPRCCPVSRRMSICMKEKMPKPNGQKIKMRHAFMTCTTSPACDSQSQMRSASVHLSIERPKPVAHCRKRTDMQLSPATKNSPDEKKQVRGKHRISTLNNRSTSIVCKVAIARGKTPARDTAKQLLLRPNLIYAHHDEVQTVVIAQSAVNLRVIGVVAVPGQARQTSGLAVEHPGAPEVSSAVGLGTGTIRKTSSVALCCHVTWDVQQLGCAQLP